MCYPFFMENKQQSTVIEAIEGVPTFYQAWAYPGQMFGDMAHPFRGVLVTYLRAPDGSEILEKITNAQIQNTRPFLEYMLPDGFRYRRAVLAGEVNEFEDGDVVALWVSTIDELA